MTGAEIGKWMIECWSANYMDDTVILYKCCVWLNCGCFKWMILLKQTKWYCKSWHNFERGKCLDVIVISPLGPHLSEQKVAMKNWPPDFFLIVSRPYRWKVAPISIFHRKVEDPWSQMNRGADHHLFWRTSSSVVELICVCRRTKTIDCRGAHVHYMSFCCVLAMGQLLSVPIVHVVVQESGFDCRPKTLSEFVVNGTLDTRRFFGYKSAHLTRCVCKLQSSFLVQLEEDVEFADLQQRQHVKKRKQKQVVMFTDIASGLRRRLLPNTSIW